MGEEALFGKAMIHDVLAGQDRRMQQAVESYDANSLLNTAAEDLAKYFASENQINALELDEAGITTELHEARVNITRDPGRHFHDSEDHYAPATQVIYHVPFTGDRDLFFVRPSQWGWSSPTAIVLEQELQLTQEGENLSAPEVTAAFDVAIQKIQRNLGYLKDDIKPFNGQLETAALAYVNARRKRLLDMRTLTESLGFPLKKVDGQRGFSVTLQRKKISVAPPKPSAGAYAPEPVLDQSTFEEILRLITSMAVVMERSPSAFAKMGEEDIRWVLLVPLNGSFEGGASGETFNFGGKTDILLRAGARSVFIAECKFWRGPSSFISALSQLLGYLSWRDTKAALIVFNRQKSFSDVLRAIPDLCSKHPCYERTLQPQSESSFRFVFHNPEDSNRKIHLAVLVFDVPQSRELAASQDS